MTTATNSNSASTLTMETIIEVMKLLPRDPIAEWMLGKGCDPDKGWVLIIPAGAVEHFSFPLPSYVRESQFVSGQAILLNTKFAQSAFSFSPPPPGSFKSALPVITITEA